MIEYFQLPEKILKYQGATGPDLLSDLKALSRRSGKMPRWAIQMAVNNLIAKYTEPENSISEITGEE